MKTKSSINVARVKTGINLEEIMSTRGKSLVLKFDEKAKSERVNFFEEHRNERKRSFGEYFI